MKKTLTFPSKDGLLITADWYDRENPIWYILLCHRSHCNRGEYQETALRLNELGFSCLAIDQRSGMKVWWYENETKNRAKAQWLPTGYTNAIQDVEAWIEYLCELSKWNPIILFWSSYSASIALFVWKDSEKVQSIICFSPSEYLKWISIKDAISDLHKRTFITSAKGEIDLVRRLLEKVDPKYITQFCPTVEGFHGSKTLWKEVPWNDTFWNALKGFLDMTSEW